MKIYLYRIDDADNVVNKTIENPTIQNINLKRDVNILNPVITLREKEGFIFDGFNYCFIDGLERYYFINNAERVHAELLTLYLEIDVLQTYKDEILNADARFNRGIKQGDYYRTALYSDVNVESDIVHSDVVLEVEDSLILTTLGV